MPVVLIVLLVFMIGMMWWQGRQAKKQQAEKQDFRTNLQPGTLVITIGGIIGKVVEVDAEYEEIVLDSEGSLLRFGFNAINREYVRPAFVHDDEVDEEGNPIVQITEESEDAEQASSQEEHGASAEAQDGAEAQTERR